MHILDSLSLGKIVQIRERLFKAQANGAKVFRFESGDPNFSIAPHVLAALKKAAEEGKTHYIPNAGIPELRKALLKKVQEKNRIPVKSSENIFVTNGAMHALYAVFTSLLDEGDEVIVPDPMWTEVVENIKLARGIPVPIPLSFQDGYEYNPVAIESKITAKTKAIFVNTPHNPTGSLLSKNTLERIIEIAKKHNLWIVSDEAYEDVVFEPHQHISLASLATPYDEKIISIFSFSKSHAMSGLRTGYLITHSSVLEERLQKVLRCSINGVNSVAQWSALAAVEGDDSYLQKMRDEYLVRRDIFFKALSGIKGVKPFLPRGSFFVWVELDAFVYKQFGVKNADELSSYLAEKGIGCAPGDSFGVSCDDALRFAFSCSTEMVKEGTEVLRRLFVEKLGNS